ncbi:MAG: hypothetical protein QOE09_1755 [Ilumatobacteraceae bacterium]|jgi:hypothetical protein
MSVSVTPQEFKFVAYDAAMIQRVAEELASSLGLEDRDLHIEVDETTPLSRTRVEMGDDTISIRAESGAFEDTKRPRQQSEVATATSLGRVLLRVRDRLVGGFGEAPPDDELSLAQIAAWETYCVGRLARLGIDVNQQRWLYNFRNRHGFTDVADKAFNRIWSSDALTWGELQSITAAA